jgi:hypothetical protein
MSADVITRMMERAGSLFHLMAIAETEILAAKKRHPSAAPRLHAAFAICAPPGALRPLAEQVYRAHVRELLERVAAGQDTRPGTDAEVLAAMSQGSLVAPPTELWAHLMERLFNAIMGPHTFLVDASMPREPHPGAADELRAELGRKLTNPDRRFDA